jgi:hypothetical protein
MKVRVNKKEFIKMIRYIKKINTTDIENLNLKDFKKSISKKDLDDWTFTGLNNVDFIKFLIE